MKVIIGTYRGPELVKRAVDSLAEHLRGGDHEIVIVDDSGNPEWVEEYRRTYGKVLTHPHAEHRGYGPSMQLVCQEAGAEMFMFFEEDFVLLEDLDLGRIAQLLENNPGLAQIALLRGPHFPLEFRYGGVLPALAKRTGTDIILSPDGLIIQSGCFTCNPAVWQAEIATLGWPQQEWSEDAQRDQLLARGFKFAYLEAARTMVKHDGKRSGDGY